MIFLYSAAYSFADEFQEKSSFIAFLTILLHLSLIHI